MNIPLNKKGVNSNYNLKLYITEDFPNEYLKNLIKYIFFSFIYIYSSFKCFLLKKKKIYYKESKFLVDFKIIHS